MHTHTHTHTPLTLQWCTHTEWGGRGEGGGEEGEEGEDHMRTAAALKARSRQSCWPSTELCGETLSKVADYLLHSHHTHIHVHVHVHAPTSYR